MILITGTNDQKIDDLRRELLLAGMISEKTTLSDLATALAQTPCVYAVLHIVDENRPALENTVFFAKHAYPKIAHVVLFSDECATDAYEGSCFDFVFPLSVRVKTLCAQITGFCIASMGINLSLRMVGALRYRLFEKDFMMLLKHFSFSDSYTALLLALMEAYPHAIESKRLMHLAFLPLGHTSRTNVSHAVKSINDRFFAAGLMTNREPLIYYDHEKGYFLRS